MHRSDHAAEHDERSFILLTGMAGAGRTTAGRVLEDEGWYVVDNLPLPMVATLIDLAEERGRHTKVAAIVDSRSREFSTSFEKYLEPVKERGWTPRVVYVTANDEAIVRRFESVRRPHPMQGDGRLLDGIRRERDLMAEVQSRADVVVDTSGLNVHQLSARIALVAGNPQTSPRWGVVSFGFKYGVPLDADIVLDLRWLPNPYWEPELRHQTGQDAAVSEFVLGQEGAAQFLDQAMDLLHTMLAGYQRENRRYVTIAVGCTGGKHRSVAMAEQLAGRLSTPSCAVTTVHRDLGRE